MEANFSFDKGSSEEVETGGQAVEYFKQAIVEFKEDAEIARKARNFLLFGQPLENREVYVLEKRPGCDLAANVVHKRLHASQFVATELLKQTNVVSFLKFYETHPLKIFNAKSAEFYEGEILLEVLKLAGQKQIAVEKSCVVDFVGSIDFLAKSVRNYLENTKLGNTCVVKLSPFAYDGFFADLPAEVLHLGLDYKYNPKDHQTSGKKLFYDVEEGAEAHLRFLEEALTRFSNIVAVIDCQVFSAEYFQGTSVPFPFSYSKKEARQLLALFRRFSEKLRFLGICHFNPTVEEKRSVSFLVDFLYELTAVEI